MTLDKDGQIIKDLERVKFGDLIQTKYYKGHILSQVKENIRVRIPCPKNNYDRKI